MRYVVCLLVAATAIGLSGCGDSATEDSKNAEGTNTPVAKPAKKQANKAKPARQSSEDEKKPRSTTNQQEEPEEKVKQATKTKAVSNQEETKPAKTASTANAPTKDAGELALINEIRQRPWDETPILKFAEWLEGRDAARTELVRVQLQLEKLDHKDPQRRAKYLEQQKILSENRERWTKALSPLGEDAQRATIKFGLIDTVEIEDATDAKIACLAGVPELRVLRIASSSLSAKGFRQLCELPNLDRLTIEGDRLDESLLVHLEHLPAWTAVRLYVSGVDWDRLDEINERRIAKFEDFSPEEKLSAGARYLSAFAYRSMLGKPPIAAQLSQTAVRDPEMRLLSGMPDLETVYISESDVTAKGIAHIAGLTKLKDLGLWDTKVESIASLSGLVNLEKLGIYPEFDTELPDDALASLANFTKLQDLYLSNEAISDATVKRLSNLKDLRKLDITVGNVEDEESLAALAGLKQLKSLSFHGGKLSDAVLRHLAGLENLETLNFHVDRGTGDGFKHLQGLGALKYVYINGKAVTDDGIAHLSTLKGLRTIMSQGSEITKAGAERLAAQLPHVTIILKESVVKSPRETYTFHRRKFGKNVSILLPDDWQSDERAYGDSIWANEDGWERVGGWSGKFVGPAVIRMYVADDKKTAEAAMMANVKNNAHLNPKILERDVQSISGSKDVASCIYQNDHDKYLVSAAKMDHGVLVLDCEAPPSRFAEFEIMFKAVARSIRISDDPARHAEQVLTVSADKVKPQRK